MNGEVDHKFIVTTTEVVVREQEVWASSLAEAAEFVEDVGGYTDGVVVTRDAFIFSAEVAE